MKKYIYLGCLVFVGVLVYAIGTQAAYAQSCTYLEGYLKAGDNNSSVEVQKLQRFLNSFETAGLQVNGVYDLNTQAAVNVFQQHYSADILTPWGITYSTGQVYITTRHKINELYCSEPIAYTAWEKNVLGDKASAPSGLSMTPVSSSNSNTENMLDTGNSVNNNPGSNGNDILSVTPSNTPTSDLTATDTSVLTDTSGASTSDTTSSGGFMSGLRGIFSSGVTLIILLILLAFVIYAMVTMKGDDTTPPQDPRKGV